MKNKLTILDKIKLEGYIKEDIYLTKSNRKYENIDIIEAHFKVLGFNEEDTKYLVSAAIMPIEEIKEYINNNNDINLINNDIKDRNLVIERVQDVGEIISFEKELSNPKVKKKSLFSK